MFTTPLALLLALSVLQLVSAQSQSCTRSYTVQDGDTCDDISAAQNVSTYQLAVVNENVINDECTNLMPGETLCLGYPGEDCTSVHVVQLGDTCDDVANAYNLNVTILYANNPQLDSACDNLYIKEVVCVASTVQVPPLPTGTLPATAIPPTSSPALPWCD